MIWMSRWRSVRLVILTARRQYDVTAGFVVGAALLFLTLVAFFAWVAEAPG